MKPEYMLLVAAAFLLWLAGPFDWHKPKRDTKPRAKPEGKFVSWYQTPHGRMQYLAWMPEHDFFQHHDEGGWFYTDVLANAHRFETEAAALEPTPVYDGSNGIEKRAGVMPV